MKLIILGIDGLEYDYVIRYKLNNIMQNDYGKTDLSDFTHIVTPVIWASFLAGDFCEEMNNIFIEQCKKYENLQKKVNGLPNFLNKYLYKFYKYYGGKKVFKNPMKITMDYLSKKGVKTIINDFKTWYVTIPGYNGLYDHIASSLLKDGMNELTLENTYGKYSEKYEKHIVNKYLMRKKMFLDSLKRNYDIWFFYTDLLDALPHLFISDKIRMMKYYSEINEFIEDIKKQLPNDVFIFVVSDHGMKQTGRFGEHSNYGFWSTSKNLNLTLKNPKPMDFYNVWFNICNNGMNKN